MATFTPPLRDGQPMTSPEANGTQNALMRFYDNWAQGVTVWKDSLGTWHESLEPYLGGATHATHNQWINGSGPISTITAPDEGLATAQVVYLGGHIYSITEAAADELEAAGYGANIMTRESIAESFDGVNGAEPGPDLTWTEEIFTDSEYHAALFNGQLWFHTTTPGAHEEILVPYPNVDSPNVETSLAIEGLTLTGTGNHQCGAGMITRWEPHSGGTYYRGYAVELSRSNIIFPGVELWVLIIWRVTSRADITVLSIDTEAFANVALPGTLTLNANGSSLNASFTHAGAGPTLTASATDSTYVDGKTVLGFGNVQSGDEVATVVVNNFTAGPA